MNDHRPRLHNVLTSSKEFFSRPFLVREPVLHNTLVQKPLLNEMLSQETFFQESLQSEAFYLSGLKTLDRSIALVLLAFGVVLVISGFVLSLSHSICGISRLLLGVAPSVAGGYHAYCMEAWRYEAHLSPAILRQRCLTLYFLAITLAGAILSLTYCG